MISSDGIRGYNDAIILTILAEGDSYGYAISKEIKERTDEIYVIKETTLYSAFTRLGKQGLITSYPGEVTHGKKRTYYAITEAGKNALAEKIAEWEQTKKVVDRFLIDT
ncbi:PadR family transcriptional regulator [Enterococcus saigonensis]|uniref:PadR family transcriptional regulator n=1 Tax=Enterococcus saigonensis TaxID=1805431 RepID=A0A679IHE3_9ENTE|nr:PadR family transcriptional regulator [Enterococcus saigonensis]BCA84556.1 PadR family transcriptional regulator [Enterococcus saigonensis]